MDAGAFGVGGIAPARLGARRGAWQWHAQRSQPCSAPALLPHQVLVFKGLGGGIPQSASARKQCSYCDELSCAKFFTTEQDLVLENAR